MHGIPYRLLHLTESVSGFKRFHDGYDLSPDALFDRQSKRLQITCPQQELMGGKQVYGGWDVCIAEPFNLVPPCLVYSIG